MKEIQRERTRILRLSRRFQSGQGPMSDALPPFVTFTTGAALLIELDLVDEITADGLRYHARKNPPWWKFGNRPDQLPYVIAGRARTMETGAFLEMFKDGPRRGGLGNKPQPPES